MVDMEGIDLLAVQGETIPGLYNKLVESIALCRYQCVYNWSFNSILIPPTYVEMEEREDGVWINEGVMVDEEDVVHIASIEPEPPAPVEPVIESLSVTENGTYTAPEGVDGYSPVTVNVASGGGSFVVDEYSHLLSSIFDTESPIASGNTIEVAFYANSYVNDGHIVGQNYNSTGSSLHLTTYSNRWYIGGTGEANFAADSDCPLYDADIVYRAKTGEVSMNGVVKSTSFTMPNRPQNTYMLNTRGGAVSTSNVYKYKYVKVYDSNDDLICHWVFGHMQIDNIVVYLAHEIILNKYKAY